MAQRAPLDVLVIEDEQDVAELLADLLSDEGYRVATVGDGPRGLEYVARYRPRVVLCDVMLPGLSGVEVLSRLETADDYRPVVILMSAAAPPSARPQDVPFISKPFNLEELLASVRAALQGPDTGPAAT
ncbi:MAG TPA: response regulator [Chloroflexota bacterium]|nr:response regulator [Chloroflexota bacterium]